MKQLADTNQLPDFDKYAIFQTGGKQYQALEGKTIAIEKIAGDAGQIIEFADVLLRKVADSVQIGTPFLGTPIKASIVKQTKGPKLIIFKFRRREKMRVKKGHRQPLTIIRIDAI
jgi:large subunit ribosomal protein L21